jgi:hypothetical protein
MPDDHQLNANSDQLPVYQIRIKGHLGNQWTEWFKDMTFTSEEDGEALLTGPVADQAALHGLLKRVRDLGLPLLSVILVDPDQADISHARCDERK